MRLGGGGTEGLPPGNTLIPEAPKGARECKREAEAREKRIRFGRKGHVRTDREHGVCGEPKAAEVGRLVGSLGRLGRQMAALPEVAEDLSAADATGASTTKIEEDVKTEVAPAEQKAGAGGGGGGKKKKKGKK